MFFLCIVLTGCAIFSLRWFRSDTIFTDVHVRPIRVLDGDQYFTSWSPDGARLALMSDTSGSWNVWTMNLNGSDLRQLTRAPSRDAAAAWSPDGRWLVFSSDRVNDVWPDLWLLDLEGHQPLQRLTRGDGKYFFPTWSPDGSSIAYIYLPTGPPYWELRVLRMSDGVVQILLTDDVFFSPPTWSPDGGKMAFVSKRSGNPDIWVLDIPRPSSVTLESAPHSLQQLTHHTAIDKEPTWSPDGRFLAFTSTRSGNEDIWVMKVPDLSPVEASMLLLTTLQQLTSYPASDHYPRWSPDGVTLAFTSDRAGHEDPWVMELSVRDLTQQ